MGASSIGRLVLLLHEQAANEGRITTKDDSATQLIDVVRRGHRSQYCKSDKRSDVTAAGLELRSGRAACKMALKVRAAALRRLENYDTFLTVARDLGYTPQVVKAALVTHHPRLKQAELGSEANCILLDIEWAAAQLDRIGWKPISRRAEGAPPITVQAVVDFMAQGLGPQEIGNRLQTNGSRLTGLVVQAISRILRGGSVDELPQSEP